MNNGTLDFSRGADAASPSIELAQVKRELLHAEVKLAKARATAAGAEADVKVLSARLKALSR
jgi:capsule polysaccharide export protein KpsE/RkpR